MTKIKKALDTKDIGARIKKLRLARNMKQDQLCEVLNISRGQYSNLERGVRNLNIHQIKLIADFFNVDLETLGVTTEKIEIPDLLSKATLIFKNEDVPLEEKQELAEMIYSMYLDVKQQIKDK